MKAFDIVVYIQNHYYLPAISVEFSKQWGCEWRTSECLSGPLKLTSASGPDNTSQHKACQSLRSVLTELRHMMWFLGLSCTVPGIGLWWSCGSLPRNYYQNILWFCDDIWVLIKCPLLFCLLLQGTLSPKSIIGLCVEWEVKSHSELVIREHRA